MARVVRWRSMWRAVLSLALLMPFTTPIATAAAGSANANSATTSPINTSGANLLLVHTASQAADIAATDISDNKGNVFQALTSSGAGSSARSRWFYCLGGTVGSGHTFTVNLSGSFPSIAVQAWANAKLVSPFDQENQGSTASGTTLQTGSVTASENDELVVAGLALGDTSAPTVTIGSGFTISDQVTFGLGLHLGVAAAWKVQTTAAAVNPQWQTFSGGSYAGAAIATFKSEPAGSSSISPSVSASASPSVAPPMTMGDLWTIEGEFSGRNNGWTDWSDDVMLDDISLRYGLMGNGPYDLVAGAGLASLTLDNGPTNSAGLTGYYSPNHANKRAGFTTGMGVRLSIQVPGHSRRYKFVGTIESIKPVAGLYGRLVTVITVTDWMDLASLTKVSALGIQLNKRSDQLFSLIVASMAIQPRAVQVGTGKDVYPFAFDNIQDESRTVLSEFSRLAQSERGRIYIKGDAVQGGTLTFEPRGARITNLTNVDVFTDQETTALDSPISRGQIINRAQAVSTQRRLGDTDTEVLYDSEQRVGIDPGTTHEFFAPYRDPLAEAERISAIDVDASPAAGTDYTATENEDGTGADYTASVTVTVGDDGNGAHVEIVNAATVKVWVWFRVLGRGLYTYRTTVSEYEDTTSVATQGQRSVTLGMPYQSSAAVASAVARYTVRLYKTPTARPALEFLLGEDEADLLARVVRREIGDRIGITEVVTGLSTALTTPVVRGYFIDAIEMRIVQGTLLNVRWTLSPTDTNNYWRLGVSGSSNIGSALIAPGQIIGHGDQTHGDTGHIDVAHGDSAHVDTSHSDSAHIDHSDGAGSHQDVAHGDSPHVDTPHNDDPGSHDDVAHEDEAHVDTAHADEAHGDTAHGDEDHGDVEHDDHDDAEAPESHTDVDHEDSLHVDGPEHVDNAHVDSAHGDVAHEDTPHEDDTEAHEDSAHVDTPHVDDAHQDHTDGTHGDVAHGDTAHVDTAHVDSAHSDVAHLDAPHVDE